MALDRGRLAKIDRKVFAELDHTDGIQVVKVPVSDAVWSIWRRYCESMGLSMGEGVAGLILDELESVVDVDGNHAATFAELLWRRTAVRDAQLDAREKELGTRAEVLSRKEVHLAEWDRRLRTLRPAGSGVHVEAKVGRNDRCPCGSGLKHKHCHGLPGC